MQTIILTLDNGEKKEYVKGIKVKEVIENLNSSNQNEVIAVKYNNEFMNLDDTLLKSGRMSLYDINTVEGNKIYERGLLYLFELSTVDVLGPDTKIIVK